MRNKAVVIRLGGHRYDRVVPETIRAMRERDAIDVVPVAVDELFGRKVIGERQGFEQQGVVTVGMKLEVEEQRCRAGDFIDKATTHAHGDIEVGRDVLRLHVGSHGTTTEKSEAPPGALIATSDTPKQIS